MPALSTLKGNRTKVRSALAREEVEADELLQQGWSNTEEHEIVWLSLSVGKVKLCLETKLTRLEAANDKLADAYKAGDENESARQFYATLDEDSEFIDNIIKKISQLRSLKEEPERK